MTAPENTIPVREDGAARLVESIQDPIVKSLVRLCLAKARIRFIRLVDQTDAEFESGLPSEPFDMEFFASVLRDAFSNRSILERILAGETLEAATSWDI